MGLGGYYVMKHTKLIWNTRMIGDIMFYVCVLGMYHHWFIKEGAGLLGSVLVITTWSLAKGILTTKEKAEHGAQAAKK